MIFSMVFSCRISFKSPSFLEDKSRTAFVRALFSRLRFPISRLSWRIFFDSEENFTEGFSMLESSRFVLFGSSSATNPRHLVRVNSKICPKRTKKINAKVARKTVTVEILGMAYFPRP